MTEGSQLANNKSSKNNNLTKILLIILGIVGVLGVVIVISIAMLSRTAIGFLGTTADIVDTGLELASESGKNEGLYVSTSLPEGWLYQESRTSDFSKGISGFELFKSGKLVFEIQAGGGGGDCTCEKYYRFPDTSDEYFDEVVECENIVATSDSPSRQNSDDITVDSLNIVDVDSNGYVEYELFGTRFRRVGGQFLTSLSNDAMSFDPYCSSSYGNSVLIEFKDLKYMYSSETEEYGDYQIIVNENVDESTLKELDAILMSMELPK